MANWRIPSVMEPNFDGGLMNAKFLIGGVRNVKTKAQRNAIKYLYRDLSAVETTMVFVEADSMLYRLINNPTSDTTQDSDWQMTSLGGISTFSPVGQWDSNNLSPVLKDSDAAGRNGEFYFVMNTPVSTVVTDPELFGGQPTSVVDGNMVVSVGTKWVVVSSSVTWNSIAKPQVITDYENGIVIAHSHLASDITDLGGILDAKYDIGDTADHTVDFDTVPDTALVEVEFLKKWYYTANDVNEIITGITGGAGGFWKVSGDTALIGNVDILTGDHRLRFISPNSQGVSIETRNSSDVVLTKFLVLPDGVQIDAGSTSIILSDPYGWKYTGDFSANQTPRHLVDKGYVDNAIATGGGANAWKLNGSTVGSEKWIGTLDNFEFPVRVNDTEIGRFQNDGLLLAGASLIDYTTALSFTATGVETLRLSPSLSTVTSTSVTIAATNATYISSGRLMVNYTTGSNPGLSVKGLGTTTGQLFLLEDSAGTDRLLMLDNGTTTISGNQSTILLVNSNSTQIFRVDDDRVYIGGQPNIQPANFGSATPSGTGLRFNLSGSNGSESHYYRGGVSASNGTLIDYQSITDNLLSYQNTTGRVFRIRVNIDNTSAVAGAIWHYLELSPNINFTGGTTTLRGIDYNPTLTATTGLTHYGLLIRNGMTGLNMGTAMPSGYALEVRQGGGINGLLRLTNGSAQNVLSIDVGGELRFGTNTNTLISPFNGSAPNITAGGLYFKANAVGMTFSTDPSASNNTQFQFGTYAQTQKNIAAGSTEVKFFAINPAYSNFAELSTGIHSVLSVAPIINLANGGTSVIAGIDYNPTLTAVQGLTHYGLIIRRGLNGIGLSTPTAKLHVKGDGSTTGVLFKLDDSTNAERFKVLDNGTVFITTVPANDDALTQLLVRDAGTGEVKYRTASTMVGAAGWTLNGTTVGSEKFIGTLDNFEFPVRVNNSEVGRFKSNGLQVAGASEIVFTTNLLFTESVASAEAMRVTSTQNVSIGGIAPIGRLHIKGAGTTTGVLFRAEDSIGTVRDSLLDNGTRTMTGITNIKAGGTNVGNGFNVISSASTRAINFYFASAGDDPRITFSTGDWVFGSESSTPTGGTIQSSRTLLIRTFSNNYGISYQSATIDTAGAGHSFSSTFSGSTGSTYVSIGGTATVSSTITTAAKVLNIAPTYNLTAGTHTIYGIDYNPTLTAIVGVTHYGLLIRAGSTGLGLATPTAKLHVRGDGISTGSLFKLEDSAATIRVNILDNGITTFTSSLITAASPGPFHFINGPTGSSGYIHTTYDHISNGTVDSNNGITFEYRYENTALVMKTMGRLMIAGGTTAGSETGVFRWDAPYLGSMMTLVWVGGGISLGQGASIIGSDIAIGGQAMGRNHEAISIGYQAGNTSGTEGLTPISIGYQANQGTGTIGNYSIAIGRAARATAAESIAIGLNLTNNQANVALIGNSNHSIGIGAPTVSARLHVKGKGTSTGELFRLDDSGGTNRFLILDNGTLKIPVMVNTILGNVLFYDPATGTVSYGSIGAQDATGTVIDFAAIKVYNSSSSPATENITDSLTNAKKGLIQKIYHNSGTAPTFPAGWVKTGTGTYLTGSLNIIYAEWCGGTRVEYWIVQ